jgi:ubiquinone/menaquinone biosynthesis C-methylase UbiE
MKDNFSQQSKLYANFRPRYSNAMYHVIYKHVSCFDKALDVATGNGQVAVELAKKFKEIYATDISEKQLNEAPRLENVFYKVESAEEATFPYQYFDLITAAQAIHWFNFDKFYATVKRILKPDGIIAVIGYGLLSVNNEIDQWFHHFYKDITVTYCYK